MQNPLRIRSFSTRQRLLLLTLMTLFAPYSAGFQHLEWSEGGTHLTFMISSVTWNLTYSDWYGSVVGAWNEWLLSPNLWLFDMILTDWQWMFIHIVWSSLLLALLTPAIRMAFVATVLLCRTGRAGMPVLFVSGAILLAVSIAGCVLSMIRNTIYGVPPGLHISFRAPDVDVRFFCPVPILLITGLQLSRRPRRVDALVQMTGQTEY